MRKKVLKVLLGILVVLAGVCLWQKELTRIIFCNLTSPTIKMDDSQWTGGESYEKLPYSDVSPEDYMNLYVPESDEPMPLFILVHGGGFISNDCTSRQAEFMYRYFRQHGYACATINYRLAQESPYPASVEDVKAAVRFLRANADKYGYDSQRFAIWGESAGGYLAAMAAVTADDEFNSVPFIGEDTSHPVSSQVSALVDFYGVINFAKWQNDFDTVGVPSFIKNIANSWISKASLEGFTSPESYYLRKEVDECTQEELDQTCAEYYIPRNFSKDSPFKVLIRHGDVDITVAQLQSKRLADVFTETLGEDKVVYQSMPGYIHADDRFYTDENLQTVKEFLDETFAEFERD